MDNALPPAYGVAPTLETLEDKAEQKDAAEPPVYTGRSVQMKEFTYDISRKGHDTLKLTLKAPEHLTKSMATFISGGQVLGTASLELFKDCSVHEIQVEIRGYLTHANLAGETVFLNNVKRLWPTDLHDKHGPNELKKGTYHWDFALDLPKEVTVPPGRGKEPRVFQLPETFLERHSRASFNYEISVEVKYAGLFASTTKCDAPFALIPLTHPSGFFSPLRELAYSEGAPLFGPKDDQEGWHALPPVSVHGTMFQVQKVDLICNIYLATPLSYTRGSVIPIFLHLTGSNQQALDLLSSPGAAKLVLRRRLNYYSEPTDSGKPWHSDTETAGTATWWQEQTDKQTDNAEERIVRGELALPLTLKPTSSMAGFDIQYEVVLLPFDTSGYVSGNEASLLEESVEIVTSYHPSPHPRPRAYRAAPAYEDPEAHSGFRILTIGRHL